jgi:hypothetical protein
LSRRDFFKRLGTVTASIIIAFKTPSFGLAAKRHKGKLHRAEPSINSEKMAELRKLLHQMRKEIKSCKQALIAQKKAGKSFGHLASRLNEMQRTIRNYHVAQGELRGKKRIQIEQPRKDNPPCEKTIAQIKKRYS